MKESNELIKILQNKIDKDELLLPTLPKIAMKVRLACDDYDTTIDDMVSIISHDAALSARIIKYANTSIIKRNSKQSINNLNQVITRIGLMNIKSIATSMAMEQLFISSHKIISKHITQFWNNTVDTSACSISLLKIYLENNPKSKLNLDTMTLISLMLNIGVLPILTEAEKQEGNLLKEDILNGCINECNSTIGSIIVDSWGFGSEFSSVINKTYDFSFNTKEVSYLDFIRISLIYNNFIKSNTEKSKFYEYYLNKEVINDIKFENNHSFIKSFSEIKSSFS